MIFHHHKCIFFHIPKVAGYTIERFLDDKPNRDASVFHPDVIFGLDKGVYTQHLNYNLMQQYVGKRFLDEYFKFCFVRNTFDRLVSAFSYSQFGPKNKNGFCDHIKNMIPSFYKMHPANHFASQMNFILDDGREVMDFVGRFENLEGDMRHVCKCLGIEHRKLPVLNKSKREDYREYYDDETIDIVKMLYRDEIEFFNFKYDS